MKRPRNRDGAARPGGRGGVATGGMIPRFHHFPGPCPCPRSADPPRRHVAPGGSSLPESTSQLLGPGPAGLLRVRSHELPSLSGAGIERGTLPSLGGEPDQPRPGRRGFGSAGHVHPGGRPSLPSKCCNRFKPGRRSSWNSSGPRPGRRPRRCWWPCVTGRETSGWRRPWHLLRFPHAIRGPSKSWMPC
jgi:hypothetical protein